ncbi:exonuclease SbcCD subunit D [Aeromicrobium chenweiae]|uniref:Nuclease SbcCD subunit D n=1 Tax=Aeromicrobium chenweiae TaxID=2079793 RepID=A0A2S0WKF1_9ACTN|nr:exonuclease SbcCD subunit D [Aeromicrobium chenweiae]AWB91762.1 exonuclease sbcCD subunit D [Aeromicrobium chenweiae]TGN32604.1 exonuclease SbcCD subunit D [Aeromicrobium chenweiae]
MKILHTSDWHLGRTLHGTDMHEHQRAFVDHVVELVREHAVSAVLISGDVYDRAIPAVETVQVLEDALGRLSELTTVIITPGNHDSAVRLGFGAGLMRDSVRILASVADLHRPVVLDDGAVEVAVYGLPYLDPETSRAVLVDETGERPARSHEGVIGAAMRRVRDDLASRPGVRSIVMAHAFVVGGEPSDSERDLSVGGVQSVPSGVFGGVDYVALGHLHGPQVVPVPGSATVARYSGSPLAYSFSERSHHKSTVLLELDVDGPPAVTLVDAPVPRRLTEIRGELSHVLSGETDAHLDDWVKITVTDPTYPADMHARVRARFAHVLHLTHEPVVGERVGAAPVVTEAMQPTRVAADFVEFVTAAPASEVELDVIQQAYDAVQAATARADR